MRWPPRWWRAWRERSRSAALDLDEWDRIKRQRVPTFPIVDRGGLCAPWDSSDDD